MLAGVDCFRSEQPQTNLSHAEVKERYQHVKCATGRDTSDVHVFNRYASITDAEASAPRPSLYAAHPLLTPTSIDIRSIRPNVKRVEKVANNKASYHPPTRLLAASSPKLVITFVLPVDGRWENFDGATVKVVFRERGCARKLFPSSRQPKEKENNGKISSRKSNP
ncbi:hypothetical protein Trydic_g21873 [Trypoxylus dichotomus]